MAVIFCENRQFLPDICGTAMRWNGGYYAFADDVKRYCAFEDDSSPYIAAAERILATPV
jgi:hypothetical protein